MRTPSRLSWFLALALLAAGCNRAAPAPATPPSPPPAASIPAQPTAPTGPSSTPPPAQDDTAHRVDQLNDQALLAIRAKNWAAAKTAAQQALALDKQSGAGWFNLGRAELGGGNPDAAIAAFNQASCCAGAGGNSPDLAYFTGQAYDAAGLPAAAADTYQRALKEFPGDTDLAAALQALQVRYSPEPVPVLEADLTGDGVTDRVDVNKGTLRISTAGGTALLEHTWPVVAGDLQPSLIRLPDGERLIHVQIPACAYPQNAFIWYNPAAKALQVVEQEKGPCALWGYVGDGRFDIYTRSVPLLLISTVRFTNGKFEPAGGRTELIASFVHDSNLPYVLSLLLPSPEMKGARDLFASPALYAAFKAKLGQGHWSAGETVQQDKNLLTIKVLQDKQPQGQLTVHFTDGQQGAMITDLTWAP